MLKLLLSESPVPATNVYVNVLPASGSLVENVPIVEFVLEPSLILFALNDIDAGVSFTLVTFIVNVVS